MSDNNETNYVNHIMAGESRFKINYPDANSAAGAEDELQISYNWLPLNVKVEAPPHTGKPEK